MSLMFSAPTRVYTGWGSSRELSDHVRALGGGRVVLVADGGMLDAGLIEPFRDLLAAADGVTVASVLGASVDPTVKDAEIAAEAAREAGARLVVGIGGGSGLSLAKAVAIRLTNDAPIDTYAGIDAVPNQPAPMIAIPTTAGSGSEVSNALVLYNTESDHNAGMRGRGYEPDIALLDGQLLQGLPEVPMRDAGVDALSHAFEALWARGATRFTDVLALDAARTIMRLLPRALDSRASEDLQGLMEASTIANLACGNSGLGLVHALSSSTVIRVSHGRQNGILLPHVAAFNGGVVIREAAELIDALPAVYEAARIPSVFEPGEVDEDSVSAMAIAATHSPFRANNRRDSSDEELIALSRAAIEPAVSPVS